MVTEGVDEALALYDAALQATGDHLADIVHAAILEEYKRRESAIPVHTGALRKALLNPNDRFHSANVSPTAKGWALEVGVTGNWGSTAVKSDRRKKGKDGTGDPKERARKRAKPTGKSSPLRASVFQGQKKKSGLIQPVTRRVVEAVHAAYEGAISAGADGLLGDVGKGRIVRRAKRKSRARRR